MNDDFGCEDNYKLYRVNNVNSASSSYEFWKILGNTGPSILCVTHHMSRKEKRYWLVLVGTWSAWGVTGWYLVALGQYRAVPVGTW